MKKANRKKIEINPKSPLDIIMNFSEESSGKACALYWFLLALP